MSIKSSITNEYERKARLFPALWTAMPAALAVLAWFPDGFKAWGLLSAVLVTCGGAYFITQFARQKGREIEEKLYQEWGGKPTTQLLRFRQENSNHYIVKDRHDAIEKLTARKLPTSEEELQDPIDADARYDAAVKDLINRTRDKQRFSLLFQENCAYGFRRNLLGLKCTGLVLSIVGLLISGAALYAKVAVFDDQQYALSIICTIMNALVTVGWLAVVNPAFVSVPAEAYAERLMEAAQALLREPDTQKRGVQ